MADETTTPAPQAGRAGGNRDSGGFRIRLSDNEMRAARSIQDAFRLRSTVAVLGFSVRTLGQLLEEGKLDALVAQQQNEAGSRPERTERAERSERTPRPDRAGRDGGRSGRQERAPRVDPFARPSRPAPVVEQAPPPEPPMEAETPADASPVATEAADSSSETDPSGESTGSAS
ncbi:MAG: hypothetical protein MUD04_07765 [Cyanobium sp. Prado107]|jgi:hypothetical protein|nr:hypothetical protein [Cyanobium sp. Prado107]